MSIKIEGITLYRLKELSEKLSITEVTLRRYIKEGKLKARKVGGQWTVSHKSLVLFLTGNNKTNDKQ